MRGFRASMKRSITRLAAIAQVRPPTIATVTQPTVHQPGQPRAASDHGDVGEGQGEDGVLELDRVEHARNLAQSPYSFQRRVTRSRISSVIAISSGQGCATSSSALFSVASTPSLPP